MGSSGDVRCPTHHPPCQPAAQLAMFTVS